MLFFQIKTFREVRMIVNRCFDILDRYRHRRIVVYGRNVKTMPKPEAVCKDGLACLEGRPQRVPLHLSHLVFSILAVGAGCAVKRTAC